MMRRKFLLLICMLLIGCEFLSKVNIVYASDSANTGKSNGDFSYYFIHYNGEEQEIVLNENVTLILTGWTDESKSSVNGIMEIHTDSSNQTNEFMIAVTNELYEITVPEKESIHYRLAVSDSFKVEEVVPSELNNKITLVAKNENGTSIEKVETIDEYETVIENQRLVYYLYDENHQKILITKEEYYSLNPVIDPSAAVESSDYTSIVSGESSREVTKKDALDNVQQFQVSSSFSTQLAVENPSVHYATHVQGIGWLNAVSDGEMSGTKGQSKRLESIKISVDNVQDLGVKYSTHVQGNGWLDFVSDGKESGTTGESKRLEAIKIELTGIKAENYDIYYRVHAQDYGWMDWVKNGELAGTTGKSKRLEAIEIKIMEKEVTPPPSSDPNLGPSVTYKAYVQSYGWLDAVSDGEMNGTIDQEKRLEALQISLEIAPYSGGISYKTHVQDYGWLASVTDGQTSGKTGENKRVESIQVSLTGEIVNHYDVYYRVFQQSFGWLDWVKNGESAGTTGLSKQLEAIEIVIVEKGGEVPGSSFIEPSVSYSTHVETYGWLDFVANGDISGTEGKAKRLEAIKINLQDAPYSGNIVYTTHVQDYGWLNHVSNGQVSGTEGKAKRLEAIQIDLSGDIANYYDVYYRVHIQGYGWLGWAKNGMNAGSEGRSKRLEAIEIKLVPKGLGEAVNEKEAFKSRLAVFIDPGHGGWDPGAIGGGYEEADLNLSVAKKVQSILLGRGYTVYMSRYDDTYVDLLDRSRIANSLDPDIFISIHHNSTGNGDTSAKGIESYYYQYFETNPPKINGGMHNDPERILKSVTLANLIQENLVVYTGAYDRGTYGETFSVVRETAVPASLFELGFINNSGERQKLVTDFYQNLLAKAIADGIEEYFKIY